ncbi:MAG: conjugative transposon protein TraN [Prolixibacteraceae bacterium]|jgi:conjugative transposon TraN protein|nr:conjugative transposon protein TraN [Prolixibacteraceae bacterium]
MKKISVIWITGFFLCLTSCNSQAQQTTDIRATTIEPYRIAIASTKTTNIIFPHAIISVDRGSKDVLAQKAGGVENVLQIKAARENFPETNLTLITADGRLNSFVINYTDRPSVLNLLLTENETEDQVLLSPGKINEAKVHQYGGEALKSREKTRGITDRKFGIRFSMNGLFIHDNTLFLRVSIRNRSNIIYDIDQLRLYIRDRKKSKRTATQEIEISPVLVHNNTGKVTGQSGSTIVLVVPKFTIPDKKYLAVRLMEKNGGRHLELHVKNRKIAKAVPVESGLKSLRGEKSE